MINNSKTHNNRKTHHMSGVLFMILFHLAAAGFISGQTVSPSIDPEREVIVMFKSDAVIPPANRTAGRPDEFQIPEQALRQLLLNANVEAIARLMPDFRPEDRYEVSRTGEEVQLTDWTNVYVIRLPQPQAREGFLNALKNRPEVIFTELHGRGEPDLIPNDQYFYRQWALKNDGTYWQGSGTPGADIKATQAWDITTGSSGMQTNHPDFTGRVTGDTGDNNSHGTGVAGVAAAQGNDTTGIAGVAWNVGIINEDYGSASDADFANAVRSAANRGSDVINNSWKLIPVGRYSTTVRLAFADVYKLNRAAVASMGNQGGEVSQYPAAFGQGIITVGATTNEDVKAVYSSTGNWIDVVAPGGAGSGSSDVKDDIYTTTPGSSYGYVAGTSFAAPVATGIAALLLSVNPDLYNDDIEQIIRIGVDDKGATGFDTWYGTGRVNARAALDLIRSPNTVKHWTASSGYSVGNTGTYTMVFFSTPGLATGVYIVKRYDVRKTVSFPQSFTSTPYVWGRGVATNGYSVASPNFGMGWCNVVSSTSTSAELQTYVYKVWAISGQYLGYYPNTPGNVTFAYTAIGEPYTPPLLSVNITGTSVLGYKHFGTFTANVTGGEGTIYYQWYRKDDGGSWQTRGTSQTQTERMVMTGFTMKVVVTRGSENAEDTHYVEYDEGEPKIALNFNLPTNYELSQNSPNPFNPVTTIRYALPEKSTVTIKIYDLFGKEVTGWVIPQQQPGYKQIVWDGRDSNSNPAASGMYIYKIIAVSQKSDKHFISNRKMVLLK